MATTAGRATPPNSSRRTESSSVSVSPPNSIAKGVTARSAATNPRVSSLNSPVARRPSVKGRTSKSPPRSSVLNGETRETLSALLKEETEQKEQLLVQLQTKDQTISALTTENNNFQSALNAADTRLNEFYADQSRMEEEMAARIEVAEKLRTQVRELEKEKRDVQRRYNEQTTTFEAERQAAYDNEQHLKSRIQSLTQARQQHEPIAAPPAVESETELEDDNHEASSNQPEPNRQDLKDPEQEPAEMTSLKLELSTLSTSYSSLQSTLLLLQTQLVDLKRVNHELQEENESYMILLREKTLSGQFDVMRQVGGSPSTYDEDDDDEPDIDPSGDVRSTSSISRSALDPVEEEITMDSFEQELERSLGPHDTDSHSQSSRSARHPGKHPRKRRSSASHSPSGASRGESLAGLPLTGPGLDLAAELGRAENKDVLEGDSIDDKDHSVLNARDKRGKKGSLDVRRATEGLELIGPPNDVDALRTEVKSLRDANKALSLYASKIIDRIISQEGFEHVLAVDFDKPPPTPTAAAPKSPAKANETKSRSQSIIFGGRSTSNPAPASQKQQRLTTFASPPISPNPDATTSSKSQRRSLSFDWKSFSMFGGKSDNPSLRPLTLKPGAAPVTGLITARKLDTEEDEEDRRERDRLQATMKLMGIESPTPTPTNAIPPTMPVDQGNSMSFSPPQPTGGSRSRWSLFGGITPGASSETSSIHSTPSMHGSPRPSVGEERPSNLTQEALAHAEAQNSLAALDAHEQALSAEMARGAGGGFTEIARRGTGQGRRSRRSRASGAGSGSGSTVWSAGIEDEGED
ncbi:hypothetical protein PILCRDRAFT_817347 [Piloderma croceum F 1598]|uniref:Uncharacterized protein n=1 Tax=Piloderma croceum (strain F 1598) TaxID=765440 RepID=A0A0C3BGC7_PILCF|nr:hypothetical protein PILCRDRAFT_817347 [Piloderma croceum F 1598]